MLTIVAMVEVRRSRISIGIRSRRRLISIGRRRRSLSNRWRLRAEEVNLAGNGEPEKVQGFDVTVNFFDLLVFNENGPRVSAEEEQPEKIRRLFSAMAVERRFASDPNILNKIVKVDGKASRS